MKKLKFPKPSKRVKKTKRLRRVRKTPMAILERKIWIIFSKYIRMRDAKKAGSIALDWLKCYTCGKDLRIEEAEAGHFIPRGKHATKFNEGNVHSQCPRCNRFLHGNLAHYTLALQSEYGQDFPTYLMIKAKRIHKFTRSELEDIRRNCALKISAMMK